MDTHHHSVLGRDMSLFLSSEEESWTWLPKGVAWLKIFKKIWKHHADFQEVINQDVMPIIQAEEEKARSILYGCYDQGDRQDLFCLPGEVVQHLISSLQMIDKNYNMLGVEFHWVLRLAKPKGYLDHAAWRPKQRWLEKAFQETGIRAVFEPSCPEQSGPLAELKGYDGFGKALTLASLSILVASEKQTSSLVHIEYRLFASLQNFTSVLLEQYSGQLPFHLAPEHLRVLTVSSDLVDYGQQIVTEAQKIGLRAYLDARECTLDEKVYSAAKAKVVKIAIVGQREAATQKAAIRGSDGRNKQVSVIDLLEELQAQHNYNRGVKSRLESQ